MKRHFLGFVVLLFMWGNIQAAQLPRPHHAINQTAILAHAPGLSSEALRFAVKGYRWAQGRGQIHNANVLTVIDFTKPSNQKRLWVINLRTDRVLLNDYVTHGKGSGYELARRFSNRINSSQTSLGVYKTLNAYRGQYGYSMRLQGLEKGINDNAFRRAIVVHPARGATPSFVNKYHLAALTRGCFGLNPSHVSRFINLTKSGSIIFAYAGPERHDRLIA